MIDEGNADVRADPVVGGDLQGGERRRELKLEGRGDRVDASRNWGGRPRLRVPRRLPS